MFDQTQDITYDLASDRFLVVFHAERHQNHHTKTYHPIQISFSCVRTSWTGVREKSVLGKIQNSP